MSSNKVGPRDEAKILLVVGGYILAGNLLLLLGLLTDDINLVIGIDWTDNQININYLHFI